MRELRRWLRTWGVLVGRNGHEKSPVDFFKGLGWGRAEWLSDGGNLWLVDVLPAEQGCKTQDYKQ